jgi:hypothetical protein
VLLAVIAHSKPGVDIDWSQAIAACVLLVLPPVTQIWRAVCAVDSLQTAYQERRLQAKSVIDSLHVSPEFAQIIVWAQTHINWGYISSAALTDDDATELIVDQLQGVAFAHRVDALTSCFLDRAQTDRLHDHARYWMIWQAWAAGIFLLPALYFTIGAALQNVHLPIAGWYATGIIASISATVWIVARIQESRARNALATIFRKYE